MRRKVTRTTGTDVAGLGLLSDREREVAQLVSAGMTNPQIASTLFLSIKTVETHIRHIFDKLGATSRLQVARMVESRGVDGA